MKIADMKSFHEYYKLLFDSYLFLSLKLGVYFDIN